MSRPDLSSLVADINEGEFDFELPAPGAYGKAIGSSPEVMEYDVNSQDSVYYPSPKGQDGEDDGSVPGTPDDEEQGVVLLHWVCACVCGCVPTI